MESLERAEELATNLEKLEKEGHGENKKTKRSENFNAMTDKEPEITNLNDFLQEKFNALHESQQQNFKSLDKRITGFSERPTIFLKNLITGEKYQEQV